MKATLLCLLMSISTLLWAQTPTIIRGDSQVGTINLKAPGNGPVDPNPDSKPLITWLDTPSAQTSEPHIKLRAHVASGSGLVKVNLFQGNRMLLQDLSPNTGSYPIALDIQLQEGRNLFYVKAENAAGFSESRELEVNYIPKDPIFQRKDYVLLFAVDRYDNGQRYPKLNSPSYDAKAIGQKLQTKYGFETPKIVIDPTTDQIIDQLAKYANIPFGPYDQLIIIFAGHGEKDDRFDGRGSFVGHDSEDMNSCLSHREFLDLVDEVDCPHILVVANACFSGMMKKYDLGEMAPTTDPVRGSRMYKEKSDHEYLKSVLQDRTRRFIASGFDKVNDATPGTVSPFTFQLLEALENGNRNGDVFLEYAELKSVLARLKVSSPVDGIFGTGKPGGTIVLVESAKR